MSNWIWLDENETQDDSYAEFKDSFKSHGKTTLRVSSDSFFVAYVNGEVALFSGCADYPHYKLYDEIDITSLCKEENELSVIVWYHGLSTQTYLRGDAGLWFEVYSDDNLVLSSSPETLSRKDVNFKHNYQKIITHQLGFSYYYDNTISNTNSFEKSKLVDKPQPTKRQQKPLVLDGRIPVSYTYFDDHILVDFGKEVAGYADLEFTSPVNQELLITFGEHLEIGKVSREIGGRDFSFEFKARKGENKWFCPLRRLACRYFEIYFKEPITPEYFGMQHVYYPVTERKKVITDPLLREIYDVSVRTLRLCMHEHYEDCPWREQALYALDSRNQMLFGYKAFLETEYQRSNLLLINQGLNDEGLLSICFPSKSHVPIPFFSLAFILEVAEYAKATGDMSIIVDTEKTVDTIISTFNKHKWENGLIPALPPPFWNFYEWSVGNDGNLSGAARGEYEPRVELILNAMYVYAINVYNEVSGKAYNTEDVALAIKRELYDESRGLYKISDKGELIGQLGNALVVLAGLGNENILEELVKCADMTPATLSMKPFLYDALLTAGEKYHDFILNDIKTVYKKMLDYGATSFWETELGWLDFDKAGSLCHGWSASPVYYLSVLGYVKDE